LFDLLPQFQGILYSSEEVPAVIEPLVDRIRIMGGESKYLQIAEF
jgi:hypothetical protein